MKRIIIILIILHFAIFIGLAAEDLHRFSVRGSIASFWNEGWGDKFFFKTFSWSDWQKGLDFNRTLRHTLYANPEIWYNIMLSDRFALSVCARYEYMEMRLADYVEFSWMIHDKQLKGSLNFFSIGGRLQLMRYFNPYLGFSMGYCYGNLTTNHVYEAPDVFISKVYVDGDGGGLFYDIVMGLNIPMVHKMSIFFEGDIRFTPGWKRFSSDKVIIEDLDDRVDWLLTEDRKLDPFLGWIIRLGVQIGIL